MLVLPRPLYASAPGGHLEVWAQHSKAAVRGWDQTIGTKHDRGHEETKVLKYERMFPTPSQPLNNLDGKVLNRKPLWKKKQTKRFAAGQQGRQAHSTISGNGRSDSLLFASSGTHVKVSQW